MRRELVLLVLTLVAGIARADEPSKPPVPPATPAPAASSAPPLTPEQAADATLAAVKEKDNEELKTLASKDAPDPWLVADELIRRGELDVAESFAKAAPRVDVARLPVYVASRRGKSGDAARRERLAKANDALGADRFADALAALGAEEPGSIEDVVGVRLAMGRGFALASLARLEASAAAHLAAGEAAERLGWLARASRAFGESGTSAYLGSAFGVARDSFQRKILVSERRGDALGSAAALGNIGSVEYQLGDYARALATFERALAAKVALGDDRGAAGTLGNIGSVYDGLGDHEHALHAYERALSTMTAIGDEAGAATLLGNIGTVYRSLGDLAKALETLERALSAMEALGDRVGAATVHSNIGNIYFARGDFPKALSTLERALAAQDAIGDKAAAAATLNNIGAVHCEIGNYGKGLATMERALAAQEALGDRTGAAVTLGDIGVLYDSLGDGLRAIAALERALAMQEASGQKSAAAMTLRLVGSASLRVGDHERALAMLERALAAQEALGEKAHVASTLGRMGVVYRHFGDYARALATQERALSAMEALKIRSEAAWTLSEIGRLHDLLGNHSSALAFHERALSAMEALGSRIGVAWTLGDIACTRCVLRDWRGAVDAAHRGAALVPLLHSGLGDEQGAAARVDYANLFTAGARAAAATGDLATVSEFLESGRAGSLLEAMGARTALQSGLVPMALAAEEAQARAKEASAAEAYRRVLDSGDLEATRARRRELDESQAAVVAAVERIQREAKAAANVVHFKPDDLATIRKRLAPDEALVLFGLFDEGPLALVVTSSGATTVPLAATKDVEAACEALLGALDHPGDLDRGRMSTDFARPARDPSAALDRLRDLVVKPLALPPETKRLLISTDGALSYVPFGLLVPDREVSYVPSGTTYGLLLEDGKARGEGLLALGDPDYDSKVDERAAGIYSRGAVGRLTRLPATADEARAIGGTVLLGKEATEKGLREAVAGKPRWRAVHFACHGLIDAERPGFSSLALTADGDDDGFLTVLEVFRSKIPSDLVVLSACETGKGKAVKGEGIMGLARAFMFAGAPRVICSLWKVDDDATRALMAKFYELWNPKDGKPGRPTVEALRKAQEFIRSQKKWEHPYYWAAWVLWGLPS